jgi:6-pyruvoyl-tetrahydropterin synthase
VVTAAAGWRVGHVEVHQDVVAGQEHRPVDQPAAVGDPPDPTGRRWTARYRVSSTSRCAINSAVYEAGTALHVRAFHVMPGMPPPEGERHSHDYRLEVVVRRNDLDERGMVLDLDLLDQALRGAAGQVDGVDLETIQPADAEAVTVEVFARWLHDQMSGALGKPPGVTLAVRVWESPLAFGGYSATW